MIPPGSTIGIVGGGQLGRMLAVAAAQLGYHCHIFDPHEQPCAAAVAAGFTRAAYDDAAALRAFAAAVDVATYEFENLPVEPLKLLGDKLRPGTRSLEIAQDRAAEKRFIESTGARVAPWREISSPDDIQSLFASSRWPIVLKTRRYGYDGKGQAVVQPDDALGAAWEAIGRQPAIAEAFVEFGDEFSVILARSADGEHAFWDSPINVHRDGILRRSYLHIPDPYGHMTEQARSTSAAIADALGHVGVLTVEFFATADGPVVNEIAPRVHNSGHWTIEGAVTSQFEQHIRAICGLPFGSTGRTGDLITMENLIGDEVNRWRELIAEPGAHLHIYGKGEARAGRKMGHVTRVTP